MARPEIAATAAVAPGPLALLAELTHACPLRCAYCSNPVELVRRSRELDTATWKRVLGEAADLGVVQAHFSGGEPLLRGDLEELVAAAVRAGIYPYLITSAIPCDADRLARLRDAGLPALQVSVQDARAEESDRAAGAQTFEAKCAAITAAKCAGLHVSLNVVLTRDNVGRVAEIVALAERLGVDELELAHVQYRGRAFANRSVLLPSPSAVELARAVVASARARSTVPIVHVLPDLANDPPRACLHGWGRSFLTVAPDGAALPCQTARGIGLEFPDVRDRSLAWIWRESPAFRRFRGTDWMPEPCRSCPRREVDLGGCRCQAFLVTSDAGATDPACGLSPDHARFEAVYRAG